MNRFEKQVDDARHKIRHAGLRPHDFTFTAALPAEFQGALDFSTDIAVTVQWKSGPAVVYEGDSGRFWVEHFERDLRDGRFPGQG